ncbi:MAG: biotin transporter BioY [Phenylobacterium sp.]|uniref:biotin transporter BioY n=1 Tax=Phenylobacterium sp. TaxID=1871053 RepID=UPI001A3D65A1|nr:biotin transporter BioY [Phenylobacterium sp.]MBL8772081.1 biotin transporter BioY [Phenylobacterium sp.]
MTAAASRKSRTRGLPPPYQAAAVVAGALALAAAGRASFDLGPVPITLQTYALFVVAGLFGGRLGLLAVLAWLAAAAFGLPVLANGAGGWRAVTGSTMGFLAGMAAAAWVVGEGAARAKGWIALTLLVLAGHAIVLAVGWAGLATFMDPMPAFTVGILPLLPGAAIKSLAVAATLRLLPR